MKKYFLSVFIVCLLVPVVCFADVEIVVTIPEATYSEIAEAFADVYDYEEENKLQSKSEFTKEKINEYIENVWIAHVKQKANVTKQETVDIAKSEIENKLDDISIKVSK